MTQQIKKQKYSRLSSTAKRLMLRAFMIDLVIILFGLGAFYWFLYVLPRYSPSGEEPLVIRPTPALTPPPASQPSQSAELEATPTPYMGMFGARFPDKFTDGETFIGENQYRSPNMSITITTGQAYDSVYYVADVYIKDINTFFTAFASGDYEVFKRKFPLDIANDNDAIFAISGDYCQLDTEGLVIRNGVLYRTTPSDEDVCILYHDGVMEAYEDHDVNIDEVIKRGAYQAWAFGPVLVKEGQAITKYRGNMANSHNPRAAIGYYEPGHYCFILVDGRQDDYSVGMTLPQLAEIFEGLGVSMAYNLDGGATAAMCFDGRLYSRPHDGGRRSSDIIYFKETSK